MASLGSFLLLLTFVIAAYAAAASVAGARRRNNRLIESGIGAFYTVAALMTVASGVIVYSFVAGDFSIRYVQRYSDSVQPLFYRITSYWGGLDGSVMFWVFLLSLFGSVAVKVNRERHRELIPYVVAHHQRGGDVLPLPDGDPQQPVRHLPDRSADRRPRANPLLQNFYMAIHPPIDVSRLRRRSPSRSRSAWRRSSPGTSMTRGCAPCAAGRCSRGSSCRSD